MGSFELMHDVHHEWKPCMRLLHTQNKSFVIERYIACDHGMKSFSHPSWSSKEHMEVLDSIKDLSDRFLNVCVYRCR